MPGCWEIRHPESYTVSGAGGSRHEMIGPLSCFLTGLGVGGIAGLLLAPKPGTDTREDVRSAAEAAVSDGRRAVEAQRERIATAAKAGLSAYRRAMGDSD